MVIQPCEARRIILSVSPSQLDAPWHKAAYDATITFRSLDAIARQKIHTEPYYCWLIYTEASEKTAKFLRRHFSACISFGELPRVNGAENAQELFERILQVAADPINSGQTVICDCTGGTKSMSIATALACNYHALTSESPMRLLLTYMPRERDNDQIQFTEFDLSRVVAEEQRKYVDQQEHIGRLRYLARFSPILAHEIKNPLNVISTSLYLLYNEPLSNDAKTQLDKIKRAFKEIDKTVGSVQKAVRGETATLTFPSFRLIEVIQRLQGRTQKLFPHLILKIEGEIGGVKLRISEEKLYSIFTNLIDNAAHATSGAGTLSFHFEKHKDRLHIRIEDNGPGIPTELQPNLFKPLQRGKNSSGTGLGLSIVRTFLIEEGGFIVFDGAFKQGTRFVIDLPMDKNGEAEL